MSEQRGNGNGPARTGPPPGRGPMGPGGMGGMGGMGMPVQKAKNFKGTLRRLAGYLKPQRMKLLAVLVTAILSTAFSIYSPKVLGQATTKLFAGMMGRINGDPNANFDLPGIWKIVVFLASLYVVSSVFSYIQQFLMAGVAQKTVYGMRNEVNEKLGKLPLKYYDSRTHGEILSRAVNDVDNISNTLQQSLTQLITSVITILGVIVMMLTISPWLTLILLLTLPLSMVVIRGAAKRSQKHFKTQQMELGMLNGHVEEMYSGHKIVKAYGQEEISVEKFDKINERLYEAGWRAQFVSGNIMPLMNMVSNIGYMFISVVGGIMVTRGSISIGNIQAFIQYARQFSMPLVQTANIANIIQSTIASAERVFELLDEEEEVPDAAEGSDAKLASPKGDVALKGVNFGYKEDAMLIENMDIDVRSGQTVAIVGPTGAGKTTLVNLLMRFYEVNGGSITVDGVDITRMQRGHLRSLFGMVLQDTWLFNGTIRDNIAYGRLGVTEEEIVEAARAAHADHFIRTLPEGYDTVLNEEASNLSQGQRQLLTIARAILADPAILILDEATSSVDTRTEVHIQKAMNQLMQGRTSFVIAHRLSTIRDADLILVMNHGSIIEKGTHNELLAQGGFYADLYNSQFVGGGMKQIVS
ncbi:ABC transporter ATP-binding protein [Cohnella endophytica]|uniref:ABC transporter ATP-binding protein n=1 Tax=Cohnella endophytica TaxID=2419778 RepID=A0A494Y9A0_9BACL|nr:ABC transporter ATP-binding protein [Cohnella endophytica]RKP57253.1 ABC transporter ATP-binding protein [Cohnella endophytica]